MFLEYMNKLKQDMPEGATLEVEFLQDGVMMKVTLENYLTLDMKLNDTDLVSKIALEGYTRRTLAAIKLSEG